MEQPLEKFQTQYIERLVQMKKKYLVSQTYKRGTGYFHEQPTTDLLLTDYDNYSLACLHRDTVKHHDKYAVIFNLGKAAHRQKLKEMLAAGSRFNLYWAVVKSISELKAYLDANYKESMRRYIQTKTNWYIPRNETLYPTLKLVFGELFIILKFRSETLIVKFEELEKV